MKVLLGWELGSGQAHIHRLAALAKMLEIQGVEPVFALKSALIKGINITWSIIPSPSLTFSGRSLSYSFADILETFGFGDVHCLQTHLKNWRSILGEIKPQFVIADHAPGLVLAAYGVMPVIVIGGGFTIPPPVEVFPMLNFPAPPESFERLEKVNETIQKVVKLNEPLGKVLNGERSFIFSIPELDPYQYLRHGDKQQYVGLHIAPIPHSRQCIESITSWAYLAHNYPYRQLIEQTLQPECEFKPLNEVLADKSLAIHHGSLTTSLACLLAGIPQLLFPRHLEEKLNTFNLSRLGVAKTVSKVTWSELLIAQAQTFELTEKATNQAKILSSWNQNYMEVVSSYLYQYL
ncbi:MAG: hypothetical protein QNJ60_15050 [Xenococcaceae cyanobacterium MO_188.B19]|nr:hypothetical protein [Xenococcaceae cyanobacterium MO_188.B19]